MSKHVRVLEEAGLVSRDVVGREHRLSLRAQPLEEVLRWLWEAKFVEVESREDGDGTEVVLTHGGFAGERIRDLHGEGWNGCLDNLEGLWRRT